MEENQDSYVRRVGGCDLDTSLWPMPDEGALAPEVRRSFLARKLAVTLYIEGRSNDDIKKLSGIGEKQVYRLIRERCLMPHDDGRPYGWRGLIRYKRVREYTRATKVRVDKFGRGASGALQNVLKIHPEIRTALERRVTGVGSNFRLTAEKRSIISSTRWFLNELRKLGYESRGEWPFNTESLGYYSIARLIKEIVSQSPKAAAYIAGGADAVKKMKTGDGSNRPVMSIMQRVEMDAHKLDGRFCIVIPTPDGTECERIIHRIWVVVLVEVVSRVVLGYHLSFGKEVNKEDVLRAIKCALTPWRPRELSFGNDAYVHGAGLPSILGTECTGLCWDETSVDGALAESCEQVRLVLDEVVGSKLYTPKEGFSARRSKDDRPFIETFFRVLGERGFQTMSNTTGGDTKARQSRAPETVALNSRFQVEYAEELLDVLIANYNVTPHSAHTGDRSPLAQLKFLLDRNPDRRRPCSDVAASVYFSTRKLCTVRGGGPSGKQPYVEFFHARYTSEALQNRIDLVNKQIWVVNHLDYDARVAMASTKEGNSLGILRAAAPWHLTPHSLGVRRAIKQLSGRHKFLLLNAADGVETFLDFVESQPRGKLPVHPAYLEARRILTEANAAIEASAVQPVGTPSETTCSAEDFIKEESTQNSTSTDVRVSGRKLPPLRRAASR